MRIVRRLSAEVAIVELRGDFDPVEGRRFLREIDDLVELAHYHVVVSFRLLYFIGSRGVSMLERAGASLELLGGKLVVAEPSRLVRSVLDRLGVGERVPVFSSERDALDYLAAEGHSVQERAVQP